MPGRRGKKRSEDRAPSSEPVDPESSVAQKSQDDDEELHVTPLSSWSPTVSSTMMGNPQPTASPPPVSAATPLPTSPPAALAETPTPFTVGGSGAGIGAAIGIGASSGGVGGVGATTAHSYSAESSLRDGSIVSSPTSTIPPVGPGAAAQVTTSGSDVPAGLQGRAALGLPPQRPTSSSSSPSKTQTQSLGSQYPIQNDQPSSEGQGAAQGTNVSASPAPPHQVLSPVQALRLQLSAASLAGYPEDVIMDGVRVATSDLAHTAGLDALVAGTSVVAPSGGASGALVGLVHPPPSTGGGAAGQKVIGKCCRAAHGSLKHMSQCKRLHRVEDAILHFFFDQNGRILQTSPPQNPSGDLPPPTSSASVAAAAGGGAVMPPAAVESTLAGSGSGGLGKVPSAAGDTSGVSSVCTPPLVPASAAPKPQATPPAAGSLTPIQLSQGLPPATTTSAGGGPAVHGSSKSTGGGVQLLSDVAAALGRSRADVAAYLDGLGGAWRVATNPGTARTTVERLVPAGWRAATSNANTVTSNTSSATAQGNTIAGNVAPGHTPQQPQLMVTAATPAGALPGNQGAAAAAPSAARTTAPRSGTPMGGLTANAARAGGGVSSYGAVDDSRTERHATPTSAAAANAATMGSPTSAGTFVSGTEGGGGGNADGGAGGGGLSDRTPLLGSSVREHTTSARRSQTPMGGTMPVERHAAIASGGPALASPTPAGAGGFGPVLGSGAGGAGGAGGGGGVTSSIAAPAQLRKRTAARVMQGTREERETHVVRSRCVADEFVLQQLDAYFLSKRAEDPREPGRMISKFMIQRAFDVLHVTNNRDLDIPANHPQHFDLFLFDYGVIVWWGTQSDAYTKLVDVMLGEAAFRAHMKHRCECAEETFKYTPVPDMSAIDFEARLNLEDRFYAPYGSSDEKLSVSHALAQSAKIDYLDAQVSKLTERCEPIPHMLQRDGTVSMSEKEMMQLRGSVLFYRLTLKSGSDLLDEPDLFWDRPWMKPMFNSTREYFLLSQSVEALDAKLGVVSEILTIVSDENSQRVAHRLEWIVIWLVALEVFIGLAELIVDARPAFLARISDTPSSSSSDRERLAIEGKGHSAVSSGGGKGATVHHATPFVAGMEDTVFGKTKKTGH